MRLLMPFVLSVMLLSIPSAVRADPTYLDNPEPISPGAPGLEEGGDEPLLELDTPVPGGVDVPSLTTTQGNCPHGSTGCRTGTDCDRYGCYRFTCYKPKWDSPYRCTKSYHRYNWNA